MCVRGGDGLDKHGRSRDTGEVLQTLPLQARESRQWGSAAQGSISLEKAPDLCLQLLTARVPALQGARWIGELPGSSFLKQEGPWIGGVHTRKGLVWVSPASLQAHREVAPVIVWCLTFREGNLSLISFLQDVGCGYGNVCLGASFPPKPTGLNFSPVRKRHRAICGWHKWSFSIISFKKVALWPQSSPYPDFGGGGACANVVCALYEFSWQKYFSWISSAVAGVDRCAHTWKLSDLQLPMVRLLPQ